MGKLHLILAVVVLFSFNFSSHAKSLGNFKCYKQITDKEILIETTNGSKVLVTAYNDYAIGVSSVGANEVLKLTSPIYIDTRTDLNGSIYVEELDDLMQITTTINHGLVMKIEKYPLRFSFVHKASSEVLFEQLTTVKFGKKSKNVNFSVGIDEQLKMVNSNNHETNAFLIKMGDVVNFEKANEFVNPENEICIVSSKGYALVLESKLAHEIDYSKNEKIKISVMGNEINNFNYLLIYGPQQPALIDKYAFHMTDAEHEIS